VYFTISIYADCNKPEHARRSDYQPFWHVSSISIHFPFLLKAGLQDGVRAHVRHLSNKRPPKNQKVMSVQHYGHANVWGGSNISTNERILFYFGRKSPHWARASSFTRFLDHTQRRTTVGRTPLDERSARRRDLYLTTHNNHNRQTSIPTVGFEPTISAGQRPQTYPLDLAGIGIGEHSQMVLYNTGYNVMVVKVFLWCLVWLWQITDQWS
jgi:hypothetical protein